MVKRAVSVLALALAVAGCGRAEPLAAGQVPLLTGEALTPAPGSVGGSCYTMGVSGRLIVDEQYGTAIVDSLFDRTVVVAWRPGFTAWQVGQEVEVRDPAGRPVATTGRDYDLDGGYTSHGFGLLPPSTDSVFWACDRVRPLPLTSGEEDNEQGPDRPVSR